MPQIEASAILVFLGVIILAALSPYLIYLAFRKTTPKNKKNQYVQLTRLPLLLCTIGYALAIFGLLLNNAGFYKVLAFDIDGVSYKLLFASAIILVFGSLLARIIIRSNEN